MQGLKGGQQGSKIDCPQVVIYTPNNSLQVIKNRQYIAPYSNWIIAANAIHSKIV
jgi:hypothetical protein